MGTNDSQKRKQALFCGILMLFVAVITVSSAVYSVIRARYNAKTYHTEVTGKVISSSVSTGTDNDTKYSTVDIRYRALNGEDQTLHLNRTPGVYKVGERVKLRCTEDRTEAVLESSTHTDMLFLCFMFCLSFMFGGVGALVVSGKVQIS